MSAFYTNLAATALALIRSKGQSLPITRTASTLDPVTGALSSPVVTSGTLDAVALPASKGTIEAFDNRIFEGLSITSIRFFLAAASSATFEPQATDVITFEGKTWSCLGMTALNPAGTPLVYKLAFALQ